MSSEPGKKEAICAVVVTYNRKHLLLECLNALLKQTYPLDAVYLIDNASTDGTPELLQEKGFISEILNTEKGALESQKTISALSENTINKKLIIHYVRMHENTGGAGGFYEGVKRGYERGYDWLWLMDDDAEPKLDCLEKLISKTKTLKSVVAGISPVKVDIKGNVQKTHRGKLRKDKWQIYPFTETDYSCSNMLIEIDYSSFVGFLVARDIIEKAGLPDKSFFIWLDDVEYCARLSEYGKLYLDKNALIIHKDKLEAEYMINNMDKLENLWKRYYGMRNNLLLYKRYRSNKFLLWFEFSYFFLRDIKNLIFNHTHKFIQLKLILLSYSHAILGKRGMQINPSEWSRKCRRIQ